MEETALFSNVQIDYGGVVDVDVCCGVEIVKATLIFVSASCFAPFHPLFFRLSSALGIVSVSVISPSSL